MLINVILYTIRVIGWMVKISRLLIGFINLIGIHIPKLLSGISIGIGEIPFIIFSLLLFQILF
jgi:ABC-type cobalamin transport system permease subunit